MDGERRVRLYDVVKDIPHSALVLTRKPGESIVMDNGVRVRVEDVHGRSVKISIQADKSVGIWREEILEV